MGARKEGRRSISPPKSMNSPSLEFSTENERPLSTGGVKRTRPDSLRPSGFAPLRVIAERDGEQSSTSLQIQDIENGEEEEDNSPSNTIRNINQQPRLGASRETGV